jgi:tetratricopeptide (TPR) repeat protein
MVVATVLDSGQLSRHVVRIDRVDGTIAGSGFFVAPGWVLTCAHVVDDVDTVWLRPGGRGEPFEAVVRGRSSSPSPGWTSGIWPFPDLALLEYSAAQGAFPCVLLAAVEPSQDRDCHTWGFARREAGVDPVGSAVALSYQGVDGDGYLSLRSGLVQPGLSGSPLVCPTRRAVVGVVADTRDPRGDHGGWASPVSALTAGEPLLPPDLAAAAAQVLRLNRAAVLGNRASWHAVLPVPEAVGQVETTWEPFVRGRKSQPSQMLVAEHLVVPYLFRDPDLDRVEGWCETPEPIALTVVAGRGGSGKTRFAIECCRRMQARGWMAGFVPGRSVATAPLPRLVVVDYAEAVSDLADLLKVLRGTATDIAPVRVLLLTRTSTFAAVDPLGPLRSEAALQRVIDDSEDATAAGAGLEPAQRVTLYEQSVARFSHAWEVAVPHGQQDLASSQYAVPLEVLVEALNAVLAGGEGNPPAAGTPAPGPGLGGLDRLLVHEEKYWRPFAPAGLDPATQRECVALATLATAADQVEADPLLGLVDELAGDQGAPARRRATAWLADLYQGAGLLNPLRPDRLGEALVADVLRRQRDHGLGLLTGVLTLQSDVQVIRGLEVITRMAVDTQAADDPLAPALIACYAGLVGRGWSRASGSTEHPGSGDLAIGLARAHARVLTDEQVMALPAALRRDLSAQMDRLADLVTQWGQPVLALTIVEQALRIDQGLAAAEPGNTGYQRDLSLSYNQLGDLAVAEGQGERARELYQQGLDIAARLAAAEPGNTGYQRDLSVSYERLGDLAVAEGQVPQALQQLGLAANRRRVLHKQEPKRLDLAEELAVTLYLMGSIARVGDQTRLRTEAQVTLGPFLHAGILSPKGRAVMDWVEQG